MSVIAKMKIDKISDFGTAKLVELTCVCENDLMAEYTTSDENRLFTKYTPWGEMKLHQPKNTVIGNEQDEVFVIIMTDEEARSFDHAIAHSKARIASMTEYGGDSKSVEITHYKKSSNIDSLHWKMSVDNPQATNQLIVGKNNYWVAFFPASLGIEGSIAAAFE